MKCILPSRTFVGAFNVTVQVPASVTGSYSLLTPLKTAVSDGTAISMLSESTASRNSRGMSSFATRAHFEDHWPIKDIIDFQYMAFQITTSKGTTLTNVSSSGGKSATQSSWSPTAVDAFVRRE